MTGIANYTALVTGATGFIGEHLARRLLDEGWKLQLLVRSRERLAPDLLNAARVIQGDLLNPDALSCAVRDVTVVFHCAANVKTWDAWENYYTANVEGVNRLTTAISSHNPSLSRLVHLSTVDVYGFPAEPCDEQCDIVKSGFGYCDSKGMGEAVVRKFGAVSGIPFTVLRPANVIGPGSPFISRIGKELESGLMLTIDGGRANAGMLDIDSLLTYMIWAATAKEAIGQCYNVRDQYDVNWREFIELLRRGLRGRGRTINMPYKLANAAAWCSEYVYRTLLPGHEPLLHRLLVRIFGRTCGHTAAKIRRDSGIEIQRSFDEAMVRSINWYLESKPHV